MKTFFILLNLFVCAFAASSASAGGFDGCYTLSSEGALHPTVCLQGTMEELIGGAGVRLAIFRANTSTATHCLFSTGLRMSKTKLEFIIGNKKEMILETEVSTSSNSTLKNGKATFGSKVLHFSELHGEPAARFSSLAADFCSKARNKR